MLNQSIQCEQNSTTQYFVSITQTMAEKDTNYGTSTAVLITAALIRANSCNLTRLALRSACSIMIHFRPLSIFSQHIGELLS